MLRLSCSVFLLAWLVLGWLPTVRGQDAREGAPSGLQGRDGSAGAYANFKDGTLADVLTSSGPAAGRAELSGAARRRYDTLVLIVQDADQAKLTIDRKKLLGEFLNRSAPFVREQPNVIAVWIVRAVAALELNRPKDGWQAGQQLVRLGADNSDDPKVRKVMALLDRNGWMGDQPPPPSSEEVLQSSAMAPIAISDLGMELVPVAAGAFAMGSGNGDERPLTQVSLSAFWLGATEVTQAQWGALMNGNPSKFRGPDRPVENVSWDDAREFCARLTKRELAAGRLPAGYVYDLPTEAQWEFACRAGSAGDFAGDLESMAWYAKNSDGSTQPVGRRQQNSWGLYDMHGNVWEWCADRYLDHLPGGSVKDPKGPENGTDRVYRGGSWWNDERDCRSSVRNGNFPTFRSALLGFRVALRPDR